MISSTFPSLLLCSSYFTLGSVFFSHLLLFHIIFYYLLTFSSSNLTTFLQHHFLSLSLPLPFLFLLFPPRLSPLPYLSSLTPSRASGKTPDADSSSGKTNASSAQLNDPTHISLPTKGSSATSNSLSFHIGLEVEKLSFTAALSTPQTSSSSSFSVNSLPFLEFAFHGLLLNAKTLDNGSHIKARMSLQEYEVYEVSPVPIGKNSSMQRISSAASFGLPYTFSQHFSQDGSEQKERTPHSPCPSTFDTIGANDVRNGLKYTRLISRRAYVNVNVTQQQQQQSNGKLNSHFFSGKLSKNSSRSLQSMAGLKGINQYNNQSNNNNNYNYSQYDRRGGSKYDVTTDALNNDVLAPLLLFEIELKLKKSKKKAKSISVIKVNNNNYEVKHDHKNSKHNEEMKGGKDMDKGEDEKKGDDEEEGGGGSCRLSMEELEILCCPSAHWIAALGTFLVLSPAPEIRWVFNFMLKIQLVVSSFLKSLLTFFYSDPTSDPDFFEILLYRLNYILTLFHACLCVTCYFHYIAKDCYVIF